MRCSTSILPPDAYRLRSVRLSRDVGVLVGSVLAVIEYIAGEKRESIYGDWREWFWTLIDVWV